MVTVTEETLSRALLLCLERAKQVVEPAGAAGVAALLEHPEAIETPVVAVLSGGNIDPLLLAKVLRHGLSAAGRYLIFRCQLPDRPGALATLLAEVAALGANVLDVCTSGWRPGCWWTRPRCCCRWRRAAPSHCDEVITGLRRAGVHAQIHLNAPRGRSRPRQASPVAGVRPDRPGGRCLRASLP